jgi:hypothetical protein
VCAAPTPAPPAAPGAGPPVMVQTNKNGCFWDRYATKPCMVQNPAVKTRGSHSSASAVPDAQMIKTCTCVYHAYQWCNLYCTCRLNCLTVVVLLQVLWHKLDVNGPTGKQCVRHTGLAHSVGNELMVLQFNGYPDAQEPKYTFAGLLRQAVDWVVIGCCIFWLLHACWNAQHETLQCVLLVSPWLCLPLCCRCTGVVSLLFAMLQYTLRAPNRSRGAGVWGLGSGVLVTCVLPGSACPSTVHQKHGAVYMH